MWPHMPREVDVLQVPIAKPSQDSAKPELANTCADGLAREPVGASGAGQTEGQGQQQDGEGQ